MKYFNCIFSILIVLLLVLCMSSCWYKQCPIQGCHVRYEHQHGGQIVRGRGAFPRIHFFGMERTAAAKREAANNRRRKQKK